jgi:hypothetical protein
MGKREDRAEIEEEDELGTDYVGPTCGSHTDIAWLNTINLPP